ncbi:hypothetical protein [Dryocola sp. BD626]|uniref:hypothetical protein n=1 Tax=Dryocola sp. BD626 TaxID=3133273 RepID=UPI003F4F6F2D
MKLIVFFIHDGLRRNLFLSLSRKAIDKKYDVKIYCFSLSEYVWFCKKGLAKHVHLLKTCKTKKINKYELVTNSIDVIAGFLNKDDALEIYFAVFHELDSLKNKEYEEIIVFGGNGLHAFDKAITGFSENNQKVKTLFTELSNIDGKLFVDRKGSNASSEYYRLLCSGLALKKSAGSFDLAEWRNDYVNKKKDSHIIKQAPENKKIRRIIHRGLGIVEFFLQTTFLPAV